MSKVKKKNDTKVKVDSKTSGYQFTRDDLILGIVIVWAICMVVFRY